jgi:Tfp pilus assembly protein PilN
MFTIDLLKGRGVPAKSRPRNIAIGAAAVVVPIVIAIAMFGFYLRNRVVISIKKNAIANFKTKIAGMSDAIELKKSFDEQKNTYNNCLSEVSGNLDRHTQWSPVLVTVVKNIPESVILTSLDVKQRSTKIKVPQKDDPKKMVDASVPLRTLQMTVIGKPQSNSDEAIRDFSERLRSSSLLEPKLENIRIAQGVAKLGEEEVVSYQIDCIFKPGM